MPTFSVYGSLEWLGELVTGRRSRWVVGGLRAVPYGAFNSAGVHLTRLQHDSISSRHAGSDYMNNVWAADMGTLLVHLPNKRFQQRALDLVSFEEISNAADEGHGAIVAGLHLGPNSAIPLILAQLGHDVSIMGSTAVIDYGRPLVEACLPDASTRIHWLALQDQHALFEARTALRKGRIVVAFFDDLKSTAARKADVEMLGSSVQLPLTLPYLSAAARSPIIPASIVREPGPRYTMTLDAALAAPARDAEAIAATARELAGVAERRILEHPEQWLGWAQLAEREGSVATAVVGQPAPS